MKRDDSPSAQTLGTLQPIPTVSDPIMTQSLAESIRNRIAEANVDVTKTVVDAVPQHEREASQRRLAMSKTVVGFGPPSLSRDPTTLTAPSATTSPNTTPASTPAAPEVPIATASATGSTLPRPDFRGTIIGLPAPNLTTPAPALASPPTASPPAHHGPSKTMLGVAMPGIAPTNAGTPPPAAPGPSRTMLGVAMPGIAPTHAGALPAEADAARPQPRLRKAVEIVPMPPPLADDDPLPTPPHVAPKKGVPVAVVSAAMAALVVVAGITAVVLWKSAPLVALPQQDAQGHDQLHLTCESCADGTTATLDIAKATFQAHTTNLTLDTPLKIGDNALVIHLDRPSLGRDEAVKLVVPIAFRIRADLSDVTAVHPSIAVRVEAVPGTDVQVEGKPVALDASGIGTYAIDISPQTEGTADDVKIIERAIPYTITPKSGTPEKGNVTARVGVTPLRLEAPGTHTVIETPTFHIAGRTAKATLVNGSPQPTVVAANGQPFTVGVDGVFESPFDAPAIGDLPVELRASAPTLAPRTAHFVIKRVDHLADEAKTREEQPALGYDAIATDVLGAVGQATIAAGEVIETRSSNEQTIAVIDDSRGCAHGPCLIRVISGGETPLKHGDVVRAYGRVTRSVSSASGNVPEMEADFIVKGKGQK